MLNTRGPLGVADVLTAFGLESNQRTLRTVDMLCTRMREFRASGAPASLATGPSAHEPSGVVCPGCGNGDVRNYDIVGEASEMVCIVCGTVVLDHMLHEGEAVRHFVDREKEDTVRPQCSRPSTYASLFSEDMNLTTVAYGGGRGVKRPKYCVDAYPVTAVLLRPSITARCRDVDKVTAITMYEEAAARIGVPRTVVDDAVRLFAKFRDARVHISSKRLSMATCLWVCLTSHCRRLAAPPTVLHGPGEPPVPQFLCGGCGKGFLTAQQRLRHWDTTPACQQVARAVERRKEVTRRRSMDLVEGMPPELLRRR